jgi:hypothetical protein
MRSWFICILVATHFRAPYKYTKKLGKRKKTKKSRNKYKKIETLEKKNKKYISVEETWRTPRKLPKTSWRVSRYIKLEKLIIQLWLMKALLKRNCKVRGL